MKKGFPILLVEDDLVDVKTVKRAFKEAKITNPLFVTGDGEEAIAFLRHEGHYENADDPPPRPGIILLDLNMPVMNGIEFLKIVKNDNDLKRIPIIVLTTSREESDRLKSYDFSVAGYISKPVDFEKFVEAIKIIDLYWTFNELP